MKRPIRRLLALTGTLLLGTFGAVALGTPAQAHHTTVTGAAVCANGKFDITWTVKNSEWDKTATILTLTKDPDTAISGFGVGTVIAVNGTVTGTQSVSASEEEAKLTVKARWTNGVEHTDSGSVNLKRLDCDSGYTGDVTGTAECDRETGSWLVTWKVANQHPTKKAEADIITASGPVAERTATLTGGVWTTLPNENAIVGISDGTDINAASSKSATQTVAGSAQGARLKVLLTWKKNSHQTKEQYVSATVLFQGKCEKNTPKPDATFASDCSGVVTVTLINSADATKDAKFVVTAAGGWTSGEKTVAPGESISVVVPAANSASVVVSENGVQLKTYSWQDSTNCHPIKVVTTHTCDGITIELTNPAKGAVHTVKLVPSSGNTITKSLQPGENATYKFDAPDGTDPFSVDVVIDDKKDSTVTWERPKGCEPVDGEIGDTCTGLVFDLKNPEDGSPAEIVLTPSFGDPVSFTLNPGQTKTVEFTAGPNGLTVSGTLNGTSLGEPIVWEKPEDCPPPTLPKTGDSVGGYIASGAGLIGLGAVVFFFARRRMVQLRRMAS